MGIGLMIAPSGLEVPEPILGVSGRPLADDSNVSQEGEYDGYNGQSEESKVDEEEEEEEEGEVEQREENENLSSGWGA